jgi:hypothetical protein
LVWDIITVWPWTGLRNSRVRDVKEQEQEDNPLNFDIEDINGVDTIPKSRLYMS